MITPIPEIEEQPEYLLTNFKVDLEKLAAMNRSFESLLLDRRCASCWGEMFQEPGQGTHIKASEHLKKIATHCSNTTNFIQSDFTVMEAVFRILTSNRNKPAALKSIYENLRKRWSDPTNPRTPSVDKLYRMLLSDTFYGISQVPQK